MHGRTVDRHTVYLMFYLIQRCYTICVMFYVIQCNCSDFTHTNQMQHHAYELIPQLNAQMNDKAGLIETPEQREDSFIKHR